MNVVMGIFSCPPYFSQNSTVRSEKSQGHQCGITQYMTRGVHNVLASDSAFQVITLYSNICSKAADSACFSPLYSGLYPGWNNLFRTQMDHIHIKKPMGFVFVFFPPELLQLFTLGKVVFIPLWPAACCFCRSPRASSWGACYVDGTWICQGSPWGRLETCCGEHPHSRGFCCCHSL